MVTLYRPTGAHAVVISKCNPDSFELKNSYPADPIIHIPKRRKTYFQNYIQANAAAHGQGIAVQRKFNFYSGTNIEWNISGNDWILLDEGYSLQFRLKNLVPNRPIVHPTPVPNVRQRNRSQSPIDMTKLISYFSKK